MGRKTRRGSGTPSTGSVVGTILSILLFVGVAVGVLILKKERRAAWNREQYGDSFDRSGGAGSGDSRFFAPGSESQSFTPSPPQNPQQGGSFTPNPLQNQNPQPGGSPPTAPQTNALKPGVRQTEPAGGFFAKNDYREYREDGALLTGFEIGYGKVFNTTVIAYLRPIWLTAKGEVYGVAYGKSQTQTAVVKARQGYAVGGIVIAGGGALEGFALTYMRIGEKHLVADDAYTSDWYGEPSRKPDGNGMKSGDGSFVVGIYGKRFDDKRGNNFDDGGGICTIGFYAWVKE